MRSCRETNFPLRRVTVYEEGNPFDDLFDKTGADVAQVTSGEVDLEPIVDENKGVSELLDAGDEEDDEGDDEGGEEDVKHPEGLVVCLCFKGL